MFKIPENLRHRVLLARPTPARLTELFSGMERKINENALDDAEIDLGFVLTDEEFGENDSIPSITLRLRKAMPKPALILPELELPE